MNRELKNQLRNIRLEGRMTPDRDWVSRNRQILCQQIANTIQPKQAPKQSIHTILSHALRLFLPKNILVLSRSASMAMIVALAAVGGWIASVSASYNSLPGDTLYNVKLATEKTELIVAAVVGTKKDHVTTILKHASNRVEEYQKSKTTDQATQALASLKKSIQSANRSLDEFNGNDGEMVEATEVAMVVTQKTDELIASLEQSGSGTSEAAVKKEVGEATHLIELTGVRAVGVLVEQQSSENLDEVKQAVEKKLEKIATDITTLNNDAAAVGSAAVSLPALAPAPGAPADTATSSGAIAVTAEQKAVEANKIVEKTVAEAKTLVEHNDLLGALKKVQELSDVKKDTAANVIEAGAVAATDSTQPGAVNTASSTPSVSAVPSVNTATGTAPTTPPTPAPSPSRQ